MRKWCRRLQPILLLALFLLPLGSSCKLPTWRADVKGFVEDGISIISMRTFGAEVDGVVRKVIPSDRRVTIRVRLKTHSQ